MWEHLHHFSSFGAIICFVTWKIRHLKVDFSCTSPGVHKSHYCIAESIMIHLKMCPLWKRLNFVMCIVIWIASHLPSARIANSGQSILGSGPMFFFFFFCSFLFGLVWFWVESLITLAPIMIPWPVSQLGPGVAIVGSQGYTSNRLPWYGRDHMILAMYLLCVLELSLPFYCSELWNTGEDSNFYLL